MESEYVYRSAGSYPPKTQQITEHKYTAISGASSFVPINSSWTNLGVQISGGMDSALLLYLTAKTVKDNNYNVSIRPIHFDIPSKLPVQPFAIIDKIEELLDFKFGDVLKYDIPLEQCTKEAVLAGRGKKEFIIKTIREILMDNTIDFEFNGNTKNPPHEFRKKFKNNDYREKNRDRTDTIYKGPKNASPHSFLDKADIVNLYMKYDLVDTLLPLTCSCDNWAETIKEKKLDVPCGQCWWCDERAYGFRQNNIIDPTPIKRYQNGNS